MSYCDVKNLPSTVKTLSRSSGEGRTRDQSFSLSRKSTRVKLDYVDPKQLKLRNPSGKLARAQEIKRQNNLAPMSAMQRIDRKLNDLFRKLAKAKRFGLDTKILDDLIFLSNYHKHREQVRLTELAEKADIREADKLALMLPSNEVPVFEKLIVPASFGRTYKAGRKVLKDRIIRHGPAEPGKVAIKRSKPRKSKPVNRGVGSY